MLSHGNLVANAKHFLFQDALTPEDRYVHAGPMFHVADSTMVFCVTWAGGAHILLDRFDLPRLVRCHRGARRDRPRARADDDPDAARAPRAASGRPRRPAAAALRGRADVREPARAGDAHAVVRLPARVRHDRGGAGRHLPSPADHRAGRHLRSVGHAIPGVQVEIRDPVRPAAAGRRGGGGVRARAERDAGLLEPRRGDARGARATTAGTAPATRAPRRRLPVPRRPPEGHDRQRRRERVLDRGRERHRLAPRRARGRGRRASRRALGRARPRGRRPGAGRRARRGGDRRALPAAASPASSCPARSSSATSRSPSRAPARCSRRSCEPQQPSRVLLEHERAHLVAERAAAKSASQRSGAIIG